MKARSGETTSAFAG